MKLDNLKEFSLKTFKSGDLKKVFSDQEGTVRFLTNNLYLNFKCIPFKGNQKVIFLKKLNNNWDGWSLIFANGKIFIISNQWLKEAVRLNDA